MNLAFDRGGEGPRLFVLLHGLGATRQVWNNLTGGGGLGASWIAPDLRGHGESPHAGDYQVGTHAADVGALVRAAGRWNEIVVVGHSMGGVIALAMADCSVLAPVRVFGLGIKVAWNVDELAGMEKFAHAPARTFATEEEAVARHLKVSGLSGLLAPESEDARAGVKPVAGGWRLACDPASASIGAPRMPELMAAARVPVHLACGSRDGLVSREQLAAYDRDAIDLPGGHNVMVENPDAVRKWIESRTM
ncbi:MAG TPA: alpha/beta hydrolase [Rhizomicrobium sp.]|nr:alpha/beta hydrolase [Rhizomicrobium sp.]